MKVLAIDPGAERLGWACLEYTEERLVYYTSGILAHHKSIPDQEYKLELISGLLDPVTALLEDHEPDLVINEIVPSVGSGNFAVSGQGYLANTAIVVANTLTFIAGIPVQQIAARSVQTKIAKKPEKKTKGITKVQVRNGVVEYFPFLKDRAKDMAADETDAIAIGLAGLAVHYPGLLNGNIIGTEA